MHILEAPDLEESLHFMEEIWKGKKKRPQTSGIRTHDIPLLQLTDPHYFLGLTRLSTNCD